MPQNKDERWSGIIGSSTILSLALLGDALLYAVLPVYAQEFGLTLPMVGVMLSANRFVRVFAYGLIANNITRFGVKKMCIIAAVMATISTTVYGFASEPTLLLFARLLWGVTYGILVLITLSYATEYKNRVGTRVGIGQAIQRIGPIIALVCGAWLISIVGPKTIFILLGIPTALSILIALNLPKLDPRVSHSKNKVTFTRPKVIDLLYFAQGYGVDGVFAISIVLILARDVSLNAALMGGSALLAMRHVGEAIAAPIFGWIADKVGANLVFALSTLATITGFYFVAVGFTISGALTMLIFRGALASLGPAVIAQSTQGSDGPLQLFAKMQAWRDLGAACGPLITGALLAYASPESLHAAVGIAMTIMFIFWAKGSLSLAKTNQN